MRVGHGGDAGRRPLDGINEDLGAEHTVDVPGVVAEEDATERGKGADEVGLPGDGGLDALDVLAAGGEVADMGGPGRGRLLLVSGHGVCELPCLSWGIGEVVGEEKAGDTETKEYKIGGREGEERDGMASYKEKTALILGRWRGSV